MKFKNSFDKSTNKGSEFTSIIKDYTLIEKDDNTLDLKESGEHDIQPEIDSYKEDCDINLLIAKYLNGDPNTGINTPFKGTDLTAYEIDLNTAYQKSLELENNNIYKTYKNTNSSLNFNDWLNEQINNTKNSKEEPTEEKEKTNE